MLAAIGSGLGAYQTMPELLLGMAVVEELAASAMVTTLIPPNLLLSSHLLSCLLYRRLPIVLL